MPKKKKETSFENDLERLEELVNKMESGDATLEESLVWFEQGMDLIRSCQAQLNNAEQKVQELIQRKALGSSAGSSRPFTSIG